jgi:hypothetical protein
MGRFLDILQGFVEFIEESDDVVDIALPREVNWLQRGSDMPVGEQMLPVMVVRRVKGGKFSRKVVILLQNDTDSLLEVMKILDCPLLKLLIPLVNCKIHQFNLAFKRNAYLNLSLPIL